MRKPEAPTSAPARRRFIGQVGVAGAVIPIAALASGASPSQAQAPASDRQASPSQGSAPQPDAGYAFFGPTEAAFVEQLVNVMCPADALTPNGVDCGLARYIDGQLAGAFGRGDRFYLEGPYLAGKAQLGYQLPLTPAEFFRAGLQAADAACEQRFGKRKFAQLAPSEADAFLQDLGNGKVVDARVPLAQWFNDFAYPLFVEACFADPMYGGNRDKVFWRLIGFPGLPAFNGQNMVTFRGKPFPAARAPQSIADFS
jgi:gluconate 2-dehydrogenase gamma chain